MVLKMLVFGCACLGFALLKRMKTKHHTYYWLLPCNARLLSEPAHDKTYNKTCVTSKDSDQSIHPTHHENTPIYFLPLKPHFYIVKLGFTGVFIIFLISAQNIDCGYSLEPPHRGGSNEYPQSMFLSRSMKNIRIFYLKKFHFLVVKFSVYLNRLVFVMVWQEVLCIPL